MTCVALEKKTIFDNEPMIIIILRRVTHNIYLPKNNSLTGATAVLLIESFFLYYIESLRFLHKIVQLWHSPTWTRILESKFFRIRLPGQKSGPCDSRQKPPVIGFTSTNIHSHKWERLRPRISSSYRWNSRMSWRKRAIWVPLISLRSEHTFHIRIISRFQ